MISQPTFVKNNQPENKSHLISSFITALQGFSKEAFHSQIKGMEFEQETIYVVFNKVYTIGVFSNDETDRASFMVLKKLNKSFRETFADQLKDPFTLDCDFIVDTILQQYTMDKLNPKNIVLITFLTVVLSIFMWFAPIFDPIENNNLAILFTGIVGLMGGYLLPQRWWSFPLSFGLSNFPSIVALLLDSSFIYSDYLATIYISSWTLIAFIRDGRKISTKPIKRVPIISNIF